MLPGRCAPPSTATPVGAVGESSDTIEEPAADPCGWSCGCGRQALLRYTVTAGFTDGWSWRSSCSASDSFSEAGAAWRTAENGTGTSWSGTTR